MADTLADTVRVRRLNLAGYILWLPVERPATAAINWETISGE